MEPIESRSSRQIMSTPKSASVTSVINASPMPMHQDRHICNHFRSHNSRENGRSARSVAMRYPSLIIANRLNRTRLFKKATLLDRVGPRNARRTIGYSHGFGVPSGQCCHSPGDWFGVGEYVRLTEAIPARRRANLESSAVVSQALSGFAMGQNA